MIHSLIWPSICDRKVSQKLPKKIYLLPLELLRIFVYTVISYKELCKREDKTMARTTQARYFIRVDTYWQNSPDYFVGPFDSREAAEQAIDSIETRDNVWLSTSTCGGDIRTAVRVYPSILTATDAKRGGMVEDMAHPKYNIIPRMPTGSEDLFYMLEAVR